MSEFVREYQDGVPCKEHRGCLNHTTHPCEGCGRIAGRYPVDIIADLRAQLEAANLTSSVLRAKLYESEDDRDNLQAQLQEAELRLKNCIGPSEHQAMITDIDHLKFQLGEACLKIAEYEHTPLEDVKVWCDGLRKGYTYLQAAYSVVMIDAKEKALSCVNNVRAGLGAGGHGSGMITEVSVGNIILDCVTDSIEETFDNFTSTTPAEAGERVAGLVEAMKPVINISDRQHYAWDRAKEAIAKARGAMRNIDKDLTLETDRDNLQAQCAAQAEALEWERTEVAKGVESIKQAIKLRNWLTEGRGPYTYNDDRWMEEFAAAIKEIESALEPLEIIARDTSNRTTTAGAGLQAAYAVARGLMESTRNVIYDILPVGDVTGDKTVKPLIGVIRSIDKALSTTPEAGKGDD